jgi:molecular chaperone DnaJ
VPYTRAILGDKLVLELVDEQVELDLPPGTQPGDEIRVEGLGVPFVGRSGRGDLVVDVHIRLPRDPEGEELELLERLDELDH